MGSLEHTPQGLIEASLTNAWNPDDPEFRYSEAEAAWHSLNDGERRWLGRVLKGFSSGELAVAKELYDLLRALDRLELPDACNYVTIHITEELRHALYFARLAEAIKLDLAAIDVDADVPPGQNLLRRMEANMRALQEDHSPEALARAVAGYHLATEGIAGISLLSVLSQVAAARPGFVSLAVGAHKLHKDEARHIAFGCYLCRMLIGRFGEGIRVAIKSELLKLNKSAKMAVLSGFERLASYGEESCMGITARALLEKADFHLKNRLRYLAPAETL